MVQHENCHYGSLLLTLVDWPSVFCSPMGGLLKGYGAYLFVTPAIVWHVAIGAPKTDR